MAIYHLSVKTIGRSQGRSATAAIAYRAGEKITDERTGQAHDYTRRRGVEHTEVFTPEGAEKWASNREQLWNAAEAAEKRINSTVAREFEVALPSELNKEQRLALVREFAGELVKRHSLAVDVSIHEPGKEGDHRNHHAHILCSTRRLGAEGFTEKSRELDDRKSGEVEKWRERWAELCNRRLELAGEVARVDHRSLEAQGIDRVPTTHLGPNVIRMERRGLRTDRGERRQEIAEQNDQIKALSAQVIDLGEARNRIEQEREHARKEDEAGKELSARNWQAAAEASPKDPGAEEQKTVLQDDRSTLETIWAAEIEKRANALQAKDDEQRRQIAAQKERIERFSATMPQKPKGILGFLKRREYSKLMEPWRETEKHLRDEYNKLTENIPRIHSAFWAIGESPTWQLKEQAERQLREERPELACKLALARGDLASLDAEWKEQKERFLPQIKAKAERTQAGAEAMVKEHREREDEHEENRPKKAEGIFTAYRAIGYRKRLDAWERTRKQLHRRYSQLRERVGLAEAYQVDTASSFYQSKAEQLAEQKARKANPELATARDQARDKEAERKKAQLKEEIKRDRQRERDQDRDRGYSR